MLPDDKILVRSLLYKFVCNGQVSPESKKTLNEISNERVKEPKQLWEMCVCCFSACFDGTVHLLYMGTIINARYMLHA